MRRILAVVAASGGLLGVAVLSSHLDLVARFVRGADDSGADDGSAGSCRGAGT